MNPGLGSIIKRVIIAVIVVAILFAIIPLVILLFKIPQGDVITRILEICIGGLALLFIFNGDKWFPV